MFAIPLIILPFVTKTHFPPPIFFHYSESSHAWNLNMVNGLQLLRLINHKTGINWITEFMDEPKKGWRICHGSD